MVTRKNLSKCHSTTTPFAAGDFQGSSHQAAMVFQVVVPKQLRDFEIGRYRSSNLNGYWHRNLCGNGIVDIDVGFRSEDSEPPRVSRRPLVLSQAAFPISA